ncbi:Lipocalin-like domain-containing protein [Pseudonocardia thermophila]|uniref:Lipocalin-like domain-containing protein n=1 Tax=Pseudonocardia thermophila TaxID=1848 RepID=A0A1M6Y0F7_PSETH|nr:lipocalin-like domain-containing protein [Pseudonocardia thermophila]SHL11684.1 Lipocalin-like domain-containing protein [Pseudonocardia thermophila]
MSPRTTSLPEGLVGAWALVGYEVPEAPPQRRYPLGQRPLGQLVYTADGYMAVHYMAGDRPPLAAPNWRIASDAERLAAVATYGGYSGRYEWLPGNGAAGDRVAHHVDASIYPNWIGTTLVRNVHLDGADLVITADPPAPGQPPVPVLRWRRRP